MNPFIFLVSILSVGGVRAMSSSPSDSSSAGAAAPVLAEGTDASSDSGNEGATPVTSNGPTGSQPTPAPAPAPAPTPPGRSTNTSQPDDDPTPDTNPSDDAAPTGNTGSGNTGAGSTGTTGGTPTPGRSGGSTNDGNATTPPTTSPTVTPTPAPSPAPAPAPSPSPAPSPAPAPVTSSPSDVVAPEQPGAGNTAGATDAPDPDVLKSGIEVITGRVTTLDVDNSDTVASVRIIDGPAHGNVTVNPDNTLALVMSETDYTGALSFSYEVTHTNGSSETTEVNLNAVPGPIAGGWGEGEFYVLEEDENGDLVVEHGDNHRDVYVSGSSDALSVEDIAALEGLNPSQISARWLMNHPEYGSSPELALDSRAGNLLWRQMSEDSFKDPASNWLHLESGYEYHMGHITVAGLRGESELHPIYITSYGEGDRPVILSDVNSHAQGIENVVFDGIELSKGFGSTVGKNIMFHDIVATGQMNISGPDHVTVKDSQVYDVYHKTPLSESDWGSHKQGIFVSRSDGILIENTLFDHNGWADGYAYDGSTDSPMPPSKFNHNVYIQNDSSDVTLRDSVIMRGASFGLQMRPGGVIEDNVFLDNNAGSFVSDGGGLGNYSLYADNVTTSGANKLFEENGRVTLGKGSYVELTTHVDNIIAHLANPDDPDEIASKTHGDPATSFVDTLYYDDTIVYNWWGSEKNDPNNVGEQNIDGLDTNVLDETTIQRFTAQLLGKETATIDDLSAYLRSKDQNDLFNGKTDAEMIIEFFQSGFGLTPDIRTDAETVRFVPNDLADGIRWDNRLNWSTEDLPGSVAGDSVDLAGNWVNYGGGSQEIDNLDMGFGGRLTVGQSKLEVEGGIATDGSKSALVIAKAGQFWASEYKDSNALTIDVDGGRFTNTGAFDGRTNVDIDGGQAILATDDGSFDVRTAGRLEISGDDASVGFDGSNGGTAVLRIEDGGTLAFNAGDDGAFGTIEEFRSGAFGDETNVLSGVSLDGRLELDVSGLSGSAAQYTLIDADQIIGSFAEVDFTGLGARDATLTLDYETDTLVLAMGATGQGSGQFGMSVVGSERDESQLDALWSALTENHAPLSDEPFGDEDESVLALA